MTDTQLLQRLGEIVDQKLEERLKPLNSRFDGVDRRLDTVDKRLDSVDKRLDTVDKRLDGVEKQMKSTNRTLRRVAKDVSYMSKTFDEAIVKQGRKISKIEAHLDIPQAQ